MLYLDNYYQYSTKLSHTENGDKAFSMILDVSPSAEDKIAIFCVLDGVTNTDSATLSSTMAAREIRAKLALLIADIDSVTDMDENGRMQYIFRAMKEAVLSADRLLFDANGHYACTASIAVAFDGWVYTANVGDSPIYLFSSMSGELTELYTCHNEAAYMIRNGKMTKEEALNDKSKNTLMLVVGGSKSLLSDADISTMKYKLPQNGVLMLGSDGALGVFSEETLLDIVSKNYYNMKKLCTEVYDRVVHENGKDDTTLIAARICIGF